MSKDESLRSIVEAIGHLPFFEKKDVRVLHGDKKYV